MTPTAPSLLRIAHRGIPRLARENTLDSFARALAAGANGIELDVHASADGVVVVHHDAELDSGPSINALTHAALLREGATAALIPTLADVCALVGTRAELFVEIKGDGIERLVTSVLSGFAGVSAIHSFDHALVQRLARSGTSHRLGLLVEQQTEDVLALMATHGALDLWPHHAIVTRVLVEDVHSIDGRVIPWTVNDRHEIARLAALGVDGLCTDDVRLLAPG